MSSTKLNFEGLATRVAAVFRSDKAPYVVTLFVAALAYVTSQTVDRYNKSPTIEYSIKKTAVLGDVVAIGGARDAASGPKMFLDKLPSFIQAGYIFSIERTYPRRML
jgi:hypothetical protein